MTTTLEDVTVAMLSGARRWPLRTHLCMKEGAPLGGKGRCGIIRADECGAGGYTIRNHPGMGASMYGGPFVEKFDTIAALVAAGWVVD